MADAKKATLAMLVDLRGVRVPQIPPMSRGEFMALWWKAFARRHTLVGLTRAKMR